MPFNVEYKLGTMNTDTGIIYPINKMWRDHKKIDFDKIERQIQYYVSDIRRMKHSLNDRSLTFLINGLIKEGVPYFTKDGNINFSFERTIVKIFFKTDDLESLKFADVTRIGINLVERDMDEKERELYSLLKSLFNQGVEGDYFGERGPNTIFLNKDSNQLNLTKSNLDSTTFVNIDTTGGITSSVPKGGKESKKYTRTNKSSFTAERISLTTRRVFYLIGHLTQADLSLLKDFNDIKDRLDIVNKCFVTRGPSDINLYGYDVVLRDTLLLAPGGQKSLAAIGSMYRDLNKITLSKFEIENMDLLMVDKPELFKEYALRDSLICLIHACYIEDANFKLDKLSIPLSLSILGSNYLRKSWSDSGYSGYQISPDYLIGDASKTSTPRGLFSAGAIGLKTNLYIANYKGGRNESFLYGIDRSTK